MNYFKKQNQVYIALGAEDLSATPSELRNSLSKISNILPGDSVLIQLSNAKDLGIGILSILLGYSNSIRMECSGISLKADSELQTLFSGLNISNSIERV